MTKEEALKQFAMYGAAWFGNSKQHFAFSSYCRQDGWSKLKKEGAIVFPVRCKWEPSAK